MKIDCPKHGETEAIVIIKNDKEIIKCYKCLHEKDESKNDSDLIEMND